jgi:fatty acid desaturase
MSAMAAEEQLNSPAFLRRVNALRQTDNWTNWWHLGREYLFLLSVTAAVLVWYEIVAAAGWSWLTAAPVTLLAWVLLGAGQHRLATLGHEASHYTLFRHRLLNELVSDWCCMFPLFTTTHTYRLQHLAHHQYPNDPQRDPDVWQMQASGHRLTWPLSPGRFLWEGLLKQLLWPGRLVRYALVRAWFRAVGGADSPYRLLRPAARSLVWGSALYLLVYLGILAALVKHQAGAAYWLLPAGLWGLACLGLLLVPENFYPLYSLRYELPPRLQACLRLTYYSLLGATLAGLTVLTGRPWWLYYLLLWLVPLGTTFALFMLLRQLVQHGNADQGRLTNTRIFLVHPLIRAAVFPLGMDYHLPHHLFPLVPHYRLRQLHELLQTTAEYRQQAVVLAGYFLPAGPPPRPPTVLEAMSLPAPQKS